MYKDGKFYLKIAIPDGTAFPNITTLGSLFYRSDLNATYIYGISGWTPLGGIASLTGDVSLVGDVVTVIGLQDNPISSQAPNLDDVLRWDGVQWIPSGVQVGGVDTFLELTDTPDSYNTQGLKLVRVKSIETGLEFSTDLPNHDHTGGTGDGGQLDHGAALTGLTDDDHTQYMLNWSNVIIVDPSSPTRFGKVYTNLTAALAASSSGEVILVMPSTYDEDITLPTGVALFGLGANCEINGTVTLPNGASDVEMHNFYVYNAASSAGRVDALYQAGTGSGKFYHCRFVASNTGAGDAAGVYIGGAGTIDLYHCDAVALDGGTDAIGAWIIAGTLNLRQCFCQGVTYDVYEAAGTLNIFAGTYLSNDLIQGTPDYPDANGLLLAIETVDGTGSGLDADKVDSFEAASPPGNSQVAVTTAGGDLQLQAGNDFFWNNLSTAGEGLGTMMEYLLGQLQNSYLAYGGSTYSYQPQRSAGWPSKEDANWATWSLGAITNPAGDEFLRDNYGGGTGQWTACGGATPYSVSTGASTMTITSKRTTDGTPTHAAIIQSMTGANAPDLYARWVGGQYSYPITGGGALDYVCGVMLAIDTLLEWVGWFIHYPLTITATGSTIQFTLVLRRYYHASTAWAPNVTTTAPWVTNVTDICTYYIPAIGPLDLHILVNNTSNLLYYGFGQYGATYLHRDRLSQTINSNFNRIILFQSYTDQSSGRYNGSWDFVRATS